MRREIVIKGAGISGLTASINLAKAGYPVTVHEVRSSAGVHREGDLQAIENWTTEEDALVALERFGIDAKFLLKPVYHVAAWDAWRNEYTARFARPCVYVARRGSDGDCLDNVLANHALNCGVRLVFNSRIDDSEADIVSTGHSRKAFGVGHGYVFDSDLADTVACILNNRLAPLGYAYMIAMGGKATITTCLTKNFQSANMYLERTVDAFRGLYKFSMRNPVQFTCTASIGTPKDKVGILTGEAGGLQDALAGFGIRYAFQSGYLAARAIIEGVNYWQLVEQDLNPSVRAAVTNRLFYNATNGLSNVGYSLFLKLFFNADLPLKMQKLYQPSRVKSALYPVARFFLRHSLIT